MPYKGGLQKNKMAALCWPFFLNAWIVVCWLYSPWETADVLDKGCGGGPGLRPGFSIVCMSTAKGLNG